MRQNIAVRASRPVVPLCATRRLPRARRHGHIRSGGQIIVTFAISLSLFLVGLIALVADLSTMFGASALVNQAAQSAAYSAATDVNLAQFRSTGVVTLNRTACAATSTNVTVRAAMGTANYVIGCAISGAQVDVTVTSKVSLPVNIGFPPQTVSATYHAFAQQGTTVPT